MTLEDIAELIAWQQQAPHRRSVDIHFGERIREEPFAFVYDYELQEGQQVSRASEINLLEEKRKTLKRQLARLQEAEKESIDGAKWGH